jgi:hypothetical protein
MSILRIGIIQFKDAYHGYIITFTQDDKNVNPPLTAHDRLFALFTESRNQARGGLGRDIQLGYAYLALVEN